MPSAATRLRRLALGWRTMAAARTTAQNVRNTDQNGDDSPKWTNRGLPTWVIGFPFLYSKISLEHDKRMGANPTRRDCYCSVWEKKPEVLEKQGVPRGFCGLCEICKKPGHLRHHPAAVPATIAYCDHHYRRIKWTHPLAFPGILLWAGPPALLYLAFLWLGKN